MINKKDVEHVAKLARIKLTDEETAKFTKQLGDIIKYVDQLNEVDTRGIEPMAHPYPLVNIIRKDIVNYKITKEELLKNAPDKEDYFLKVPKIN